MNNKFQPLNEFEVVCFNWEPVGREFNLNSNSFIEVHLTDIDFMAVIKRSLSVSEKTKNKLFNEGIEGYALKYGAQDWQSGKIRVKLTVEFCPDEPEVEETPAPNEAEASELESPLDDIRQMIKAETE